MMSRKKVQFSCAPSSKEVCKMPWFLIEVVPTILPHEISEYGRRDYYIVHSVDIWENESKNKYIDGRVMFQHNGVMLNGKVLIASENRTWIEMELPKYTGKVNEALRCQKMYVVQYSSKPDNFFLSIEPECNVYSLPMMPNRLCHAIITVEGKQYVATILHKCNDMVVSDDVMARLKLTCFEVGFKDHLHTKHNEGNLEWMVVQYSKGPSSLCYTILNKKSAHWHEENTYKDCVIYFLEKGIVYQAIILQKSSSYEELLGSMNELRKCSWECLYTQRRGYALYLPIHTPGSQEVIPNFPQTP